MGSAGGTAAYVYLKRKKREEKAKWKCVEVSDHKNVGATIEEWQKKWVDSLQLCRRWKSRSNQPLSALYAKRVNK